MPNRESLRGLQDKSLDEVVRYRLDNDTWCLLIAVIQIVGGLVGIGLYIYAFGSSPPTLQMTLLFAPTLWAIYAGVLLWKGKEKGLRHSTWLSAIQIPEIMFPGFGYSLFVGAKFTCGWMGSSFALNTFLGYNATMYVGQNPERYGLAVNLVAVTTLLLLRRARKRLSQPSQIEGPDADDHSKPEPGDEVTP